jgi:hypothetical protein
MSTGFGIDFVNDTAHEHLLVEISYEKQRLCQISKEGGNENMEIEFLTDLYLLPESVRMKFSLKEFERCIREAADELGKCSREVSSMAGHMTAWCCLGGRPDDCRA